MDVAVSRSLIAAAREALENAYIPYSNFAVGAAVLTADGTIFVGTNVENASYGLTMCAERVALFSATAAGFRDLAAIAVTSRKLRPIAPCGACRQVMAELLTSTADVILDTGSEPLMMSVNELLPLAFGPTDLNG